MSAPNSSQFQTINSFSQLSEFLRSAVTDEESLQMGESIGMVASHIEAMSAQLKAGVGRDVWATLLMDFLTVVREHKVFVVSLSPEWRGLYEYPSYLNALNNFRVLMGQWLMDLSRQKPQPGAVQPGSALPGLNEFEAMAWRTIGEGMLMIDMYQELAQRPESAEPGSRLGELDETRLERAQHWWERLRI